MPWSSNDWRVKRFIENAAFHGCTCEVLHTGITWGFSTYSVILVKGENWDKAKDFEFKVGGGYVNCVSLSKLFTNAPK